MAEMIRCDHCGTSLRLPEAYVGQDVRCPSCQQVFTAKLSAPSPVTPTLPLDEPPPRLQPRDPVDEEEEARLARRRRSYERARLGEMRMLPHRGGIVLALGLGSIFLSCFTGIGIALGVGAIVMASTDLAKMRDERMDPSGRTLTVFGQVCGIIGAAVSALAIFAFCALSVMGKIK